MTLLRHAGDFVRADRTALVVYDMQVGILEQLPHGAEVLERVLAVLDLVRSAGAPIFFMRHLSLPRALMGGFQMRQAMAWQRTDDPARVTPWFLRDSPGFALAPELGPRDDEAILDKLGFSAFEGTPLAMALRDLGRPSFLICGIATEIGIDPTVRHGADLGLVPIVVEDACGHGDAASAARSIENMRHMGDAIVIGAAELRRLLEIRDDAASSP